MVNEEQKTTFHHLWSVLLDPKRPLSNQFFILTPPLFHSSLIGLIYNIYIATIELGPILRTSYQVITCFSDSNNTHN